MSQWLAKQVLDIGVYGVVWPHISTVEEAYNAVAACRYPRPKTAAAYEPEGQRGDAPTHAARYWGIPPQEYYRKADVWPLNPEGEILVIIMCEDVKAIDNLSEILKQVPGIGVVLIGEGDLSQNLGYPRQYRAPRRHRSDDRNPEDLPRTQRRLRPPARRREKRTDRRRRGLPFSHDGTGARLPGTGSLPADHEEKLIQFPTSNSQLPKENVRTFWVKVGGLEMFERFSPRLVKPPEFGSWELGVGS